MDAELATSLRGPSPFLDDLRKGAFYLSLFFIHSGKWSGEMARQTRKRAPLFLPFSHKGARRPTSIFGVSIVHGLMSARTSEIGIGGRGVGCYANCQLMSWASSVDLVLVPPLNGWDTPARSNVFMVAVLIWSDLTERARLSKRCSFFAARERR